MTSASRQVVHNKHVGFKHVHRTPDHPGAQPDKLRVGNIQVTGFAAPVSLLAQCRQGHSVHALRHREGACLPSLCYHNDDRLQSGTGQCLSDRGITADVAEADHPRRVDRHTIFFIFHTSDPDIPAGKSLSHARFDERRASARCERSGPRYF